MSIAQKIGTDFFGRVMNHAAECICDECRAADHKKSLLAAAASLRAQVETLTERVNKYRARLEIDHHYEGREVLVRVDLPFDEDEDYDGIECRDETIRLLYQVKDENAELIAALRAELAEQNCATCGHRMTLNEHTGMMGGRRHHAQCILGDPMQGIGSATIGVALSPPSPACIGYPDCDGDLVAEDHSESCPAAIAKQQK